MFGYVKPHVPLLRVRDYEYYRAAYCGLCRSMGSVLGQASRLTLSYDFAFLVMLRSALEKTAPAFSSGSCIAHPTKKRMYLESCHATEYSAAMAALLAYHKNLDDLSDERGVYRILSAVIYPVSSGIKNKAERYLCDSTASENIGEYLSALNRLEQENSSSLDETSATFGSLLSYVFSGGLTGEAYDIAVCLGDCIGRFIYMCDAACDLEDDIKRRRYNPIRTGWGELATENGKISPIVKSSLEVSLPLVLSPAEKALERLKAYSPDHAFLPVIENTVYLGLTSALNSGFTKNRDGICKKSTADAAKTASIQV